MKKIQAFVLPLTLALFACNPDPGGTDAEPSPGSDGGQTVDAAAVDSNSAAVDSNMAGADTLASLPDSHVAMPDTGSMTPDTFPVDAFVELTCGQAISCVLGQCGPTDQTCIDGCAAQTCTSNGALWTDLVTCLNTNCTTDCAGGLSTPACGTCRETHCQTEYVACGAGTC